MNIHFQRKIASDELLETLFFATGSVPTKEKTAECYLLKSKNLIVSVNHFRSIAINGEKCKSVSEAKLVIQRECV